MHALIGVPYFKGTFALVIGVITVFQMSMSIFYKRDNEGSEDLKPESYAARY